MSTYSYLEGTDFESINQNSIDKILEDLPNNTSKLIHPLDVRNAVYTLWENTILKRVLKGSKYYIGLDSTGNGLQKTKFYFGKRQFSGVDIMSTVLLNSLTDIFIYNNKEDNVSNDITRVQFLAGTQSDLFENSPYIQSEYVYGVTQSIINFKFINDIGNIELKSIEDGNYGVIINGIRFPYINPASSSVYSGYYLQYGPDGNIIISTQSSISSIYSASTVSIVGSPVLINNEETNFFTDVNPVPQDIGGIKAGATFSNVSIVEMMRELIYPYISPSVSFTITIGTNPSTTNAIIELGDISTLNTGFTYTYIATPKTNPINFCEVTTGMTPVVVSPPITQINTGTLSIAASSLVIGSSGIKTYLLSLGDGIQTQTASATVTKVYPYFYGITSSILNGATAQNFINSNPTKIIKTKSDTVIPLVSNYLGYAYFIYPVSYGTLSSILDNNNFECINNFTYSIFSINSPFWSLTSFYFYRSDQSYFGYPPSFINPVNYTFKY